MEKVCFWVAAAFLFVLLPAFGTNIVVNPGFESGLSGWTTNPCVGPSCSIFGPDQWSAAPLYPHTGLNAANSGCVSALCLDPAGGDWIAQTLTTVPSTTYVLSFWMDPHGTPGDATVEIDTFWDGVLVGTFAAEPEGYHQYFVTGLIATSTSTLLKISGRSDPFLVFLDDIEVDVPEPMSVALGGLGLGLLGLLQTRRNR